MSTITEPVRLWNRSNPINLPARRRASDGTITPTHTADRPTIDDGVVSAVHVDVDAHVDLPAWYTAHLVATERSFALRVASGQLMLGAPSASRPDRKPSRRQLEQAAERAEAAEQAAVKARAELEAAQARIAELEAGGAKKGARS